MLQPGESETAAVRAVFIMDPKGKVRLMMYYPLNVGRNMAEIKRSLLALQTSDGRIQGSIATSLVIFNKSNLVFFLDNTLNFRIT
ncbi:alkyl hydroperoxide reductase subunit AhpC, partial [Flavobacterium sp. 7E]|nr:alkyl hydroperoxide reductase subunit AhpC [Flavobacterium sp. 7E]